MSYSNRDGRVFHTCGLAAKVLHVHGMTRCWSQKAAAAVGDKVTVIRYVCVGARPDNDWCTTRFHNSLFSMHSDNIFSQAIWLCPSNADILLFMRNMGMQRRRLRRWWWQWSWWRWWWRRYNTVWISNTSMDHSLPEELRQYVLVRTPTTSRAILPASTIQPHFTSAPPECIHSMHYSASKNE